MKAAFHTGRRTLVLRDIPVPEPGPHEYLVKIEACAICGSDTWWREEPVNETVHGHEAAGTVAACGGGTNRFRAGDRVVSYAMLGCGACAPCANGLPTHCPSRCFVEGGFQEYAVFHERQLLPCPDGSDFVAASLLSDAIGVPLHGLRRLPAGAGDTVCVWGLGPLGLLQVLFLKAAGVERILGVDIVPERLARAVEAGAATVVDASRPDAAARIREACDGLGAHRAYTFVRDAAATRAVFESTRDGAGICTYVGLGGEFDLPEWRERSLFWSFYFTPGEYPENIEYLGRHGIDPRCVVSDVVPLDAINDAFRLRFDCPGATQKIVIRMKA